MPPTPPNIRRFVITHVEARDDGTRRLTLARGINATYATRVEAEEALVAFRGGLARVLNAAELDSLRVDEVECYHHGDPVRFYVEG